jgi:hypothetical protein
MDGIGTRLRAQAGDNALIDQSYAPEQVSNVGAALKTAGAWLRETHNLEPVAVGHRVAHGGPDYDRPVLIDSKVLTFFQAGVLTGVLITSGSVRTAGSPVKWPGVDWLILREPIRVTFEII